MLSCSGTRMYNPNYKLGMEARVSPGDAIENERKVEPRVN